ncbi:unnamed protein product [Lactuca saligna]|uniref:Glutamate N-acetyltransferase n=1 Tax=Lactuca saligna TaxID=75948 RepID=A0AA35ZA95_LACSI|nr:unnamed protein product [Lactuca saligna]
MNSINTLHGAGRTLSTDNFANVDGGTSTNDTIIALASGLSGSNMISSLHSSEGNQLQMCLDAVMQGLAKSIAWDGEGATCLIEVVIYGRDPNWGRIACAVGCVGIFFDSNALRIALGDILLMEGGQPLPFDRAAASNYLKEAGDAHGTVKIQISIGDGPGTGLAWGCDLSYDYVKTNYATSLGPGSLDKCCSSKCSHDAGYQDVIDCSYALSNDRNQKIGEKPLLSVSSFVQAARNNVLLEICYKNSTGGSELSTN